MGADLVRFEDFELDSRAYQLRRSGRALKLERIPMEVLCLLVERGGELVTREEIIEKLWGKNVFLDTDNAINTAIRKIRQALRDDPEQPRFVQTITGRGYRFIAPVAEPGTGSEAKDRKEIPLGPQRQKEPEPHRCGSRRDASGFLGSGDLVANIRTCRGTQSLPSAGDWRNISITLRTTPRSALMPQRLNLGAQISCLLAFD